MGVSIVMPFRNSERWIEEALVSIQNQTFKDWELIAIDDSSEDQSAEMVRRFSATDDRICLYKNNDKGIISALQTALEKVKYPLITRLDSDDRMPDHRLEKMVAALTEFGPGNLVTGKVSYFSDHEISTGYKNYEAWLNQRVENEDFYEWRFRECVIASPAWLMYTEDLKKAGGFKNLTYPEDYNLVLRWLYAGICFNGIRETVLHWREHPDRTSRNHQGFQQKAFFELKLRFILEKEYHENFQILLLTSATPKTALIQDFLSEKRIRTKEFSIHTIHELPSDNNNLLLSAVFPNRLQREKLENWVHQKGYRHGFNFFYL
jgi:glycosyltransferase involved in cell wall biosynthesis